MTDRIYAYTVILENQIGEEDAEAITQAIQMIRGVRGVTPLVADAGLLFAEETARWELGQKLMQIVYPRKK